MRTGFLQKIKIYFSALIIISLLNNLFIFLLLLFNVNIPDSTKNDIYNILFFSILIQIILVIYFLVYVRKNLKKDLSCLKQVVLEITKGNYNYEPEEIINKDPEINNLLSKLLKMKESILHFDNLKKEKIIEHRNRILAMLNLTESGFIIFNIKGNIIYISDLLKTIFPSIEENTNIFSTNYSQEIENTIKKIVLQITKTSLKTEPQSVYFHSLKKHITVKSSLIRDSRGIPIGFLICLINLNSLKMQNELKELEKPSSEKLQADIVTKK